MITSCNSILFLVNSIRKNFWKYCSLYVQAQKFLYFRINGIPCIHLLQLLSKKEHEQGIVQLLPWLLPQKFPGTIKCQLNNSIRSVTNTKVKVEVLFPSVLYLFINIASLQRWGDMFRYFHENSFLHYEAQIFVTACYSLRKQVYRINKIAYLSIFSDS